MSNCVAVRTKDRFNFLNFNKPLKTEYEVKVSKNTGPADFENKKLYKRGKGLIMKRMDLLRDIEIQKEERANRPKTAKEWYYTRPCIGVSPGAKKEKPKRFQKPKLKSGTEHWRTTNQFYQQQRPKTSQTYRGRRPQWTKPRAGFVSNSRTGRSEYKTKFGELGYNPMKVYNRAMTARPAADDSLKDGTSQMTCQIPGYAGFLPTARTHSNASKQSMGANTRTTFIKTNLLDN